MQKSKIFKNFQSVFKFFPRNLRTTTGLLNKAKLPNQESFLNGSSGQYLEDMYNAWLKNPGGVHPSWNSYFQNGFYDRPLTLAPAGKNEVYLKELNVSPAHSYAKSAAVSASPNTVEEHLIVQAIIRSYQVRGHLAARTSPLSEMYELSDKSTTITQQLGHPPSEVINSHKISQSMYDTVYKLPLTTLIGGNETGLPLKEIIKRLELVYCRHIGIEYMHLNNKEECNWIRQRFELPGISQLKKPEKRLMLTRLARAVLFEAFLQKKWSAEKRFGIEGCDVVLPCIATLIDESVLKGANMIVLGMAHRGRLNVLANICESPLIKIFGQFHSLESLDEGSGDVKYHLGVYAEIKHQTTNKDIKVVMIANPSHLEMVNPVVTGRAKAEQFYRNDQQGKTVVPIVLHGDAAICGQGVVYENISFSRVPSFNVGGTIHIVINNQIGFTTDPQFSRSSTYCTDVAKLIDAPIFHVNADDPEMVTYACKVAAEWRNTFQRDVVIDVIGYRRYGHNEQDEPMFTQPLMYARIKKIKNIFEKYREVAIKEGVTNEAEVKSFKEEYEKALEEAYEQGAKETKIQFKDWIDSPWHGFFKDNDEPKSMSTGVSENILNHIADKFSHPPPDFVIHRALERIFHMRQGLVKNKTADWALGEALAFGSILKEGFHVMFVGEDVERGTFSHRHHVIHHQIKEKTSYTFLQDLYPGQAKYTICNSPISEFGILGFQHGYAMADPNALVIWESQFGDFANNGQALFDCMIASGQSKWERQCGMVCLLPHGLEGQGPEHSSARVERFLQLSDDDSDYLPPDSPDFAINQLRNINWIVANCTVPANFFHIMRRQLKLPFRKPLILMTPKSLLRHPEARSSFDDMKEGTEFRRVIPATGPASENPDNVKKLIFCTGKVYFDFMDAIKKNNVDDKIAVTRVEQISPFPYDLIQQECQKYKNAQIAWGQEEHKNSGCWTYVHPRFETALKGEKDVTYIGRAPAASTASGNKIRYQKQYKALMEDATK